MRDRIELLAAQVEEGAEFVRERIEGLTDGEFFWEPVPGCWSVRENRGDPPPVIFTTTPNTRPWVTEDGWVWTAPGEAGWLDDGGRTPVTTIAWLLVHLASCKLMYHDYAYGSAALRFEDLVPTTAAEAAALFEGGHARLTAALASLSDDAELDQERATNWGAKWPAWRIFWTMASHDLRHGADIGRMRDLWVHRAALGPS